MKRVTKGLVWVLVLGALGYGVLHAYRMVQERKKLAMPGEKIPGAPMVAVHRVQTATLINSVSLTGEVEALARVDVVPKITGRLERLRLPNGELIEEGTVVNQGQVIAVIEHSALEAAVESAEASLAHEKVHAKPEVIESKIMEAEASVGAARAQLAELEANLRNLEKEKNRMVQLYKAGFATEQMRDTAVTAFQAAVKKREALRAQVDRAEAVLALVRTQTQELAEAEVAQARATLHQAQVNLDEATIEAPISGLISRKQIDEGDMVGPTKPLVTIVDMDKVKVVGGVSECHLSALVAGKTTARLAVDTYPGEQFEGVVHRVGPDVDRQTRTMEVEVRIPNPDHRLKPGMFARLEVILERRENVTVVSDAALVRQGPEVYVYAVNNAKAQRCPVKLGLQQGVYHEVIGGLTPGDFVIVRGQHMVQDGDSVIMIEENGHEPS
jgi:multidrug efflux pump subunit AcrA (membrane-fusion protein)